MMRGIRALTSAELLKYQDHLLQLNADDRRLRFGFLIGDDGVRAHVARIDLRRDAILVKVNGDLRVIAAVHIAHSLLTARAGHSAELAFSVDREWRGQGSGRQLFEHALAWVRNRGIRRAIIYYLTDNYAMRHLARKFGMTIRMESGECEGCLALPPATAFSLLREIAAERWAMWEEQRQRRPLPLVARPAY